MEDIMKIVNLLPANASTWKHVTNIKAGHTVQNHFDWLSNISLIYD